MADNKDDNKNDDAPLGRPSRATPIEAAEPVEMPQVIGDTFAERAAAREKAEKKAVASRSAENKAVASSESKRRK